MSSFTGAAEGGGRAGRGRGATPSRDEAAPFWEELGVRQAYRVLPYPLVDERGWFARYLSVPDAGGEHGPPVFVQFNHSCTRKRGTIRGLHLQVGRGLEAKFLKCIRGRVLDVVLDLRRGSPTFLEHAAVELSAENRVAVYAPPGVAHGFQTLEPDTELIYHHTNVYVPSAERGVRFDDPRADIQWPEPPAEISPKDRGWPLLTAEFTGFDVD